MRASPAQPRLRRSCSRRPLVARLRSAGQAQKEAGAGRSGHCQPSSPPWHPCPLTSVRYSAWCLVATNTTVWSWGRTTLRSRCSSTAALASSRTRRKEVCGGAGAAGER